MSYNPKLSSVIKNILPTASSDGGVGAWATGSFSAATRPSGSLTQTPPANISFTTTTTTPLSGQSSFVFSRSAAAQGNCAYIPFTVEPINQAKVLTIEMDYIVSSGTFVPGSSGVDGDLIVYIQDVTNGTFIEPSSFKFLSNSTTISDKFTAQFQTSSNGTSYRLLLYVPNSTATPYSLELDEISVEPSKYVFGTPITDWISYTPTINVGSGTSPVSGGTATVSGRRRRVGDTYEFRGTLSFTNTPATFSQLFVTTGGLTVDTSKLTATGGATQAVGLAVLRRTGVKAYPGIIRHLPSASDYVEVMYNVTDATAASTTQPAELATTTNLLPSGFVNTDTIEWSFSLPILGASSSVQTSDQADTRVVAARAFRNTTAQTILTNATTVVVLNGLSYDTHGGFNLTTGEYTIRVPGYYRVNAMLYLSAITAGEAVGVYIMKGSSTVSEPFIRASSAGDAIPTLSTTVYCNAGEVLKLAVDSAADTSFDVLATSKVSYMEIERVSGPSAIAASETVAAEYSSSAGLSIPDASNRYLDFPTKINDTHGAVVGAGGGNAASATSTWRFVAPISGRYLVVGQCNVVMSGTTNGLDLFVSITVNGSVVRRGSRTAFPSTSTGNAYSSMVVGEVSVLAGDYISISVYQSSGGARNQEGSAAQNYVNIVRVGN